MDVAQAQARIDRLTWYHEFDFGNGLKTRASCRDLHRPIWQFIERNLEDVDFRGKSVLDIGSWDGYWSFYAERRGAGSVLATDDRTQNWSDGQGILLARELLGSSIAVDQDVSVYDLQALNQKFDIILFLGVYYHLFDPFQAFTQLRHCCHDNTLVLIDGPVGTGLVPGSSLHNYHDHNCEWLPTWEALLQVLQASYFSVTTPEYLEPTHPLGPCERPGRLGWRWRLRMCAQALRGARRAITALARHTEPGPMAHRRVFLKCVPFQGANTIHAYRPPFGLHRYDSRFNGSSDK